MNTFEDKCAQIKDHIVGDEGLIVQIQSRKTINQPLFAQTITLIDDILPECQQRSDIPKTLAVCFIDIWSSFTNRYYSEAEQNTLQDMAITLQEKAEQLFASSPIGDAEKG